MLTDIPSNAIAMLTSDDVDVQRLGLQAIQFNETAEDLLELYKLMDKYNHVVFSIGVSDKGMLDRYPIENIEIYKPFYKNNDITITKQRD